MWLTSILKKMSEKQKYLELNQYTQKLRYATIVSFPKKIKNFDFEGYFHLSEKSRDTEI